MIGDESSVNLETLLKRWSELEPERCWSAGRSADEQMVYKVVADDEEHLVRLWAYRITTYPMLLAAVMEAIEARGWEWMVTLDGGSYDSDVGPTENPFLGQQYNSETPAHALLSAYVAALEAEEE